MAADHFLFKRTRLRKRIISLMIVVCAELWPLPVETAAWPDETFDRLEGTENRSTDADGGKLPVLPRRSASGSSEPDPGLLSTGDWRSEEVSEAVKSQFDFLGKLLVRSEDFDTSDFTEMVTTNFSCAPLRPAKLIEVFQDHSIMVSREDTSKSDHPMPRQQGPDRFFRVLQRLCEPLEGREDVHVRFKVFKVELDGDTAITHVFFQSIGRGDSGAIQQSATWICRWQLAESLMKLEQVDVKDYEEVVISGGREPVFSDCTQAVLGGNESFHQQMVWGIDHWRSRIPASYGISVGGFHGLALGDVNGDGLDDVYVCQPGGIPNRLFVREPDGSATDISHSAGVDWLDATVSALFIDLDNDGDQDLVLGTSTEIVFLSNDGNGRFRVERKLATKSIPFSLVAADYDNDTRIDLYACVYDTSAPFSGSSAPMPWHDANNGGANILIRNEGAWRFRDVTAEVGLDVNNRRHSYAASWEDYDNDGDMDLYVSNDFGRNNLYRNDGRRFVDVAAQSGVEDMAAGMSVSWGDYNRDGLMDLYVGNMFSAAGNRITYQRKFKTGQDETTLGEIRRHARGNSLFRNNGDGTFLDVSVEAGVTMGRWAWSSIFVDLNNDGLEDLYVVNGFVTQDAAVDL